MKGALNPFPKVEDAISSFCKLAGFYRVSYFCITSLVLGGDKSRAITALKEESCQQYDVSISTWHLTRPKRES